MQTYDHKTRDGRTVTVTVPQDDKPHLVVGLNVSAGMITVIARSLNKADAEEAARNAPARYFKHITIIPFDGSPYQLQPSITNF